jgi:diguanylate cyclase (GGDEF)-like protein
VRANVQAARPDDLRITVSVGYASMVGDEYPSHDQLFDAADAALYSAKEAGRNRVAAFNGRRSDDAPRALREPAG